VPICASPAVPLQVIGKMPSAATSIYENMNGTVEHYLADVTPMRPTQLPLVIVRKTQMFLDTASCSHLFVAKEKTAIEKVGWDNFLLVEYRSEPSTATGGVWYYGGTTVTSEIVDIVDPQRIVTKAESPTVPGDTLDPRVPSRALFGYEPLAIDLMTRIPPNSHTFELTLYVLDPGGFGSTTDVWIFPQ
jgi:hypothetical protein